MAADDARAQRIRDLKESRPDVTWPQVADAIPIGLRSVAVWASTGAISYDNCVKLAGFFEVDPDWLWRGPKEATPDLMGAMGRELPAETAQLDRIERKQDETLALLKLLVAAGAQEPPGELGQIAGGSPPKPPRPEQDDSTTEQDDQQGTGEA